MPTSCLAGIVLALAACGGHSSPGAGDAPNGDGPAGVHVLSDDHPGDTGFGSDPAVVWYEDFEEGSVGAITGRYDQAQGMARMQVVTDHPVKSSGAAALALTAGGAVSAVDLFKQLPNHDELYWRWYVKYQAGVPWHHSGVWLGGYDPAMAFPSP